MLKVLSKVPLIPFHRSSGGDDNNKNDGGRNNDVSKNTVIESFCRACFRETSVLDFAKTYDVIEPVPKGGVGDGSRDTNRDDGSAAVTTFLMVHGGGGSRAMFRPHAELLSQRRSSGGGGGYRCVLIDLPGHGTMADIPLTLDGCVETVLSILRQEGLDPAHTIYVGTSLGAYTGFYTLDRLRSKYQVTLAGAVLMDCGQNVGPDCSLKASAGLWFLKILGKAMSNLGLMKAMLSVTQKPTQWKLVESTFGAGMFFDSAEQQVQCLHAVAPANHIPTLPFPILYINGSEDHRDSEDLWLSLCQDQVGSSLKVYEGGDHFFSHDSRFVDDLLDRMDAFAAKAVADQG